MSGLWWHFVLLSRPPSPEIVATYKGGTITRDDLRRYLHELLPRGNKEPACGDHGQGHEECREGESCESFTGCAKSHGDLHSLPVYRQMAMELVVDRLFAKQIAARKLADRNESRHLMKHVTEEIDLSSLHRGWHKDKIFVDDAEIREYYEKNRDKYGSTSLAEAQEQIKAVLSREKERTFEENYLRELRMNANLTLSYELLKYPEPDTEQLRTVFFKRQEEFQLPARVKLLLVDMPIGTAGTSAGELSRRVRASLLDGKTLPEINGIIAEESKTFKAVPTDWISEKDPLWKKLSIASRLPGDVTEFVKTGTMQLVARVEQREESRPMKFEEVREQLAAQEAPLLRERFLSENKSSTLFTIHGEAYSLGDFADEFKELPEHVQSQYDSYEGRRKLADKMVDRALVLEGGSDDLRTGSNRRQIERIRLEVLKQVLHQEDVDDKISITEDELREFFIKNSKNYRYPARVKVNLLRIDFKDGDGKKGKEVADKALAELKSISKDQLDGEGFARVVRQYSTSSALAKNGGRIEDWIEESSDELNELFFHQFHMNIMSGKKGELTPVFRMGESYCIAFIRDREDARERTYEDAKSKVQEDMKDIKHRDLMVQMGEKLLRQEDIRIYEYTLWEMLKEEGLNPLEHAGDGL